MRFPNVAFLRIPILLFICSFALFMRGVAQENATGVILEVFEIDDSLYPQIDVYFAAYNGNSGTAIQNIRSNNLRASLGGESVTVNSVESLVGNNRPSQIILLFDLTNSVGSDFLNQQIETAAALIDDLDVNDQVGVARFSGSPDDLGMLVPIAPDHNAALNAIDNLQINQASSNLFYDGMMRAIEAFPSNTTADLRRALVVLTDVDTPHGTSNQEAIIAAAQARGIKIYIIGFEGANPDVIRPYALQTNGFLYLTENLDQSLSSLGEDLTDVLSQEYFLRLTASNSVSELAIPLELTLDQGPGFETSLVMNLQPRPRPITVSFPRINPEEPRSGTITFEPEIIYADSNEIPELRSVAYYVQDSRGEDSLLNPADSRNPVFQWNINEMAGGTYNLRVEVFDNVGNQGTATVQILVASPIEIRVLRPVPNQDTGLIEHQTGNFIVETEISSSYALNQARLLVDGEVVEEVTGARLEQEQIVFTWQPDTNAFGEYTLRVEASNVNNDNVFVEIPVNISGNGWLPFLILLAVVIILVLIGIFVSFGRKPKKVGAAYHGGPAIVRLSPQPSIIPLKDGLTLLGRSEEAHIVIYGRSASRNHARIEGFNGQFMYIDERMDNPSSLNGQKLKGIHQLHEGDRISIGETQLIFTAYPDNYLRKP